MGRPKNEVPRTTGEINGYLWEKSIVVCPRCKSDTRVLFSPSSKVASAIECNNCNWYQHAKKQKRGKRNVE